MAFVKVGSPGRPWEQWAAPLTYKQGLKNPKSLPHFRVQACAGYSFQYLAKPVNAY